MNYELILCHEVGELARYSVSEDGLTIGRASDCDIVVRDSMVSRCHARFWRRNGDLHVTDLGSRNGTFLNGALVEEGALKPSDTVRVGSHQLNVVAREEAPSTTTTISSEHARGLVETMTTEGSVHLPVLYRAAQLLSEVFDMDELLQRILVLAAEATTAKRGYIVTLSPNDGEPVVRAALPRDGQSHDLPMSKTLLDHVFQRRSAVLTLNAQQDARFSGADSVIGHHIQAAMCAPLCGREDLLGAVYVDTGAAGGVFTNDDLQLLTAIGRVVGVAIQNARLHRTIVEQERLAAMGQATAGVAHCLKNILVGIRGGSDYFDYAIAKRSWEGVDKGWGTAKKAMERMEGLVNDLMTYSRPADIAILPVDLDGLVAEAVALLQPRAQAKHVAITFKRGDVGAVRVDGRALYRVVLNLLNNAVDACEEQGGLVAMSTARRGGELRIEVRDNGPGIPSVFMPRLFQAFASTKGSRGLGLGLACSRKIVEEHGGRIDVQNRPGKGATFTIVIPDSSVPLEDMDTTLTP